MTKNLDVVVVGAGLAGLAAGATASQAGLSVVVLEARNPGGRARVTERDGFVLNQGVHALYMGGPGIAVLRSLGVHPLGTAPPLDRYKALAGGVQHRMPFGAGSAGSTTLLGTRAQGQYVAVLDAVRDAEPSKLADLSMAAWLASHDLSSEVDALVRAFVRLVTYTGAIDQLGADAAVAQLQIAARAGVIYVDDGWRQLTDGLAARVRIDRARTVRAVEADVRGVRVLTNDATYTAKSAVVAAGTPAATRAVLPTDPAWGDLGEPVTVACLDVGARRVPTPGYVLSMDEPLYGTTQSPPARQAPDDGAVVALVRYGARRADEDRAQLEAYRQTVGVADQDVVVCRFLARMVVAGALPLAARGGLLGRPGITASGLPRVFIAGDWVGPEGLLGDAALASGQQAALAALASLDPSFVAS